MQRFASHNTSFLCKGQAQKASVDDKGVVQLTLKSI